MRLSTLIKLAAGAAAGYAAAHALMQREQLPQEVPPAVRDPLERAGARLRAARTEATGVLVEMERARAAAEQELTAEYLQRQGRAASTDGGAPGA